MPIPGLRSHLEARQQQPSPSRRFNPPQARVSVRPPARSRGQRLGRASASLHRSLNFNFPNDMGVESVHSLTLFIYQMLREIKINPSPFFLM